MKLEGERWRTFVSTVRLAKAIGRALMYESRHGGGARRQGGEIRVEKICDRLHVGYCDEHRAPAPR